VESTLTSHVINPAASARVYRGLYAAGIGAPNDDSVYSDRFVVLGHQRWADIVEAAAAYMDRVHSWRALHLDPVDDPAELIPRIPRAVHTHVVYLRHPHPCVRVVNDQLP
jgi:hypothetical protein